MLEVLLAVALLIGAANGSWLMWVLSDPGFQPRRQVPATTAVGAALAGSRRDGVGWVRVVRGVGCGRSGVAGDLTTAYPDAVDSADPAHRPHRGRARCVRESPDRLGLSRLPVDQCRAEAFSVRLGAERFDGLDVAGGVAQVLFLSL